MVGTNQEILVEGICKSNENLIYGRTMNNKIVNVKASKSLIGKCITVYREF